MSQRFDELDVGRCIANYLIVILHAGGLAVQYGRSGALETVIGDFVTQRGCNFALPALFVISGYLLFYGYRPADWLRRVGRRARRLMLPYVAWNAVFVAFYLAAAGFVPRIAERVGRFGLDTVGGALGKIVGLCVTPIDVPLWYVRFVFVFAVLSPVLWPFLRHRVGRVILLCAAAGYYVGSAFGGFGFTRVEGYPPSACLAMVVGAVLGAKGCRLRFESLWWPAVGLAGLTLDLAEALGWGTCGGWELRMVVKTPLFFWLVGKIDVPRLMSRPWFQKAREASFFVFCGHFFFCSLWAHGLAGLGRNWAVGSYLLPLFLFLGPGLATTVAGWAVFRRIPSRN